MDSKTCCIVASVALGGVCISLLAYNSYYNAKKKSLKGLAAPEKKKVEVDLELDQGHLQWLQKCTEEFSLPSTDKALRVLLTYAQQVGSETVIFEQIRCNFCNNKQKVSRKHTIDFVNDQYLDEMVSKHRLISKSKAVRIIIDYAMTSNDEKTIFEVKRCSHGDTCTNC